MLAIQRALSSFASSRRSATIILLAVITVISSGQPVLASEDSPNTLTTTIVVSLDDFDAIPDGNYQHIRLRGASLDNMYRHAGNPELPVLIKWFLLPSDKTVLDMEVVASRKIRIPGSYVPYPILGEENQLDAPPDNPPWGAAVFPAETGIIAKVGQARRYRLAKLIVYPLEYDALSQQLTMLQAMHVNVTLRGLTTAEMASGITIRRPEAVDDVFGFYRSWVRRIVENPEDLDRFYPRYDGDAASEAPDRDKVQPLAERVPAASFVSEWPSTDGVAADYIIITNDYDENGSYIGNMVCTFVTWKDKLEEETPLKVMVFSVDGIVGEYDGFDRADRIRNFIRHALLDWGITYVLLGGDESVVPTRRLSGPGVDSWARPDPPADHWYRRLGGPMDTLGTWIEYWNTNGNAWFGEDHVDVGADSNHAFSAFSLSRLPARNVYEAASMLNKVDRYHFPPTDPGTSWYTSALAVAGITNEEGLNPELHLGLNGILTAEYVLRETLPEQTWTVERLYPNVGFATAEGCSAQQNICFYDLHNYVTERTGGEYWYGSDFFDTLNNPVTCPHILYFMEHSMRDRLGRPTCYEARCRPPTGGCPPDWDCSGCQAMLENHLKATVEHLDVNQVMALQNGESGPRYFFAFSSGSWTSMMDMDSIGEAFLRAPDGGAICYVGKAATKGTTHYKEMQKAVEINLVQDDAVSFCWGIQQAVEAVSVGAYYEIKTACDLTILGEPYIWAYGADRFQPDVVVTPNPITNLGIQTIRVRVVEPGTSAPVEGALVGVSQGDLLWARTTSNSSGWATLKGIAIQDSGDSVFVTAVKPGLVPKRIGVPLDVSDANVVYSSHEVSDCGNGGDCDGTLEAGEKAYVAVTMKNVGNARSQMGFACLRPSPSIVYDLRINDTFRPQDTLLGKDSARPEVATNTFRVPLTRQGARVEGEPFSIFPPTRETYKVWRDEGTGRYTVAGYSNSGSSDSVFVGILKGNGDFSDVSMIGESGDEYFWEADSIWFEFHGDATEDRMTFKAEAPNWLTVDTVAVALPGLQPGDSATVSFPVTILGAIPDRTDLTFTVTAYQGLMDKTYFHSDFVEKMARSQVELVSIDKRFGAFGCQDTSWMWTPVMQNSGSAEADSVYLVLSKTAGQGTIADSVVTFSRLAPDSIAMNGGFVICLSCIGDTAGFSGTIRQETFYKELCDIAFHDGGGGGGWPRPANLEVDLVDGTVVLRWDPIAYEPITGYEIEYANVPDPEPAELNWLDRIGTEATRYQVPIELVVPGENGSGYETPYYFFVTGCVGEACGWISSRVGPVYPWVRERDGWPRRVPGMPICAPLAVDLSEYSNDVDYAIFAATDKVYAWDADGEPLDRSTSDGLFYTPPGVGEAPGVDQRFVEALAFGDWACLFGQPEIAGNMCAGGVYVFSVNCAGQSGCSSFHCRDDETHSRQSPAIVSRVRASGTDLLFVGGVHDSYIHAWNLDYPSEPVGDEGRFARYPDGSDYNYQSLAIGYATDPSAPFDPQYDVIAVTRTGWLSCFSTDNIYMDLAEARWEHHLDSAWLSTPAVGDVTGDGGNDVVVTNLWRGGQPCQFGTGPNAKYTVPGQIWIFDENTGHSLLPEDQTSCDWNFRRSQSQFPPGGPALAQMDADAALEIIVAGNTSGGVNATGDPVQMTIHVVHFIDGDSVLTYDSVTDSIPFTQRNEEGPGHVFGGYGVHYPVGTPVVADIDPDGAYAKPDIFVTTNQGAIYAFEYDYQGVEPGERLYAKPGWPLLIQDVAREPVLAQLDPNTEQYSLVVQCQDGLIHVYDLPMTGNELPEPAWGSYGGDSENRRAKLSGEPYMRNRPDGPVVEASSGAPSIESIRPLPASGSQEVIIASRRPQNICVDVHDVSGRLVRNVFSGRIEEGETILHWDLRQENGSRVPSGIYWYRLDWSAGKQVRRIVVLH